MLNQWVGIGNVSGLKWGDTSKGTPFCEFVLLNYTPGFGGKAQENHIPCAMFGDRALKAQETLGDGQLVAVMGKLEARQYQGKYGAQVSYKVIVYAIDRVGHEDAEPDPQHDPEYAEAPEY